MQTNVFPCLPDFEILLLNPSQCALQKVTQTHPIVQVVAFPKLLFAPGDHFSGNGPSKLAQTVKFASLEYQNSVISPQRILQPLIDNNLINKYFVGVPNFDFVVLGGGKQQPQIAPIIQGQNVILVVDSLAVDKHQGFLLIVLKKAQLKEASRHDQSHAVLKRQQVAVDLSAEEREQAAGSP